MDQLLWLLLGIVIGVSGAVPVVWMMVRRSRRRARDATRRAHKAERLAELGAMTSGLAHEIKNPLSTIGLNAQLLVEGLEDSDLEQDSKARLLRRLQALQREIERLSGILTDFLQYAGRVRLDAIPHDLRQVVEELSDFFHPQCDRAGVVLRTQLTDEPLPVVIDEKLLKQAILNLMINALQAMESDAADGGDLILSMAVDSDEAIIHVIDTGPGIDKDRIESIFHPFVSGKSTGTGLGLPTARRIVDEHDGRLEVVSEVGRGTDFSIHLPLHVSQ